MGTTRRNLNIKLVRGKATSPIVSMSELPAVPEPKKKQRLPLQPNSNFLFSPDDFLLNEPLIRPMGVPVFKEVSHCFVEVAKMLETAVGEYDSTVWNGGSFLLKFDGMNPNLEYRFEYNAGRAGGASSFALEVSEAGLDDENHNALALGFQRYYEDSAPGTKGVVTARLTGVFRKRQTGSHGVLKKITGSLRGGKSPKLEAGDPRLEGINLLMAAIMREGFPITPLDRQNRSEYESPLQQVILT